MKGKRENNVQPMSLDQFELGMLRFMVSVFKPNSLGTPYRVDYVFWQDFFVK